MVAALRDSLCIRHSVIMTSTLVYDDRSVVFIVWFSLSVKSRSKWSPLKVISSRENLKPVTVAKLIFIFSKWSFFHTFEKNISCPILQRRVLIYHLPIRSLSFRPMRGRPPYLLWPNNLGDILKFLSFFLLLNLVRTLLQHDQGPGSRQPGYPDQEHCWDRLKEKLKWDLMPAFSYPTTCWCWFTALWHHW